MAGIEFNSGQSEVTIDGPVTIDTADFSDEGTHTRLDDLIDGSNAIILGLEDNGNLIELTNTHLDTANVLLTAIDSHVDGIEGLLTTTNAILTTVDGHVDGIETLLGTTNSTLTTIDGHVDGLETLVGATNTALNTANSHLANLELYTDTIESLLGSEIINTAGIRTDLGTDGAGTTPTSGTGVRGWLHSAFDKLEAIRSLLAGTLTIGLPSGAATSANQSTEITALSHLTDNTQQTRITNGTNIADVLLGDAGKNGILTAGALKTVAFNITTNSSSTTFDVGEYTWISVQLLTKGTSSTTTFEISTDSSNWQSCALMLSTTLGGSSVTSTTASTGIWHGPLPGRYFRITVSGLSAGATTGNLQAFASSRPTQTMQVSIGGTATIAGTVQPGNTQNTTPWVVSGKPPITSLNAVSATGVGTALDTGGAMINATLQVHTTGTITTISINLEGSNNNTDWVVLTTSTATVSADYLVIAPAGATMRYYRANLTVLTGVTQVVTATVAAR